MRTHNRSLESRICGAAQSCVSQVAISLLLLQEGAKGSVAKCEGSWGFENLFGMDRCV